MDEHFERFTTVVFAAAQWPGAWIIAFVIMVACVVDAWWYYLGDKED